MALRKPLVDVSGRMTELDAADRLAGVPHTVGWISGLELVWNSATSISATPGAAHIESTDSILEVSSTVTASSLSLANSTGYYVYLYSDSGTPTLEISTTAPSVYSGKAASKTGATTRRLIGWLRTDGSGNVIPFEHCAETGLYSYRLTATGDGLQILQTGVATSATPLDCSSVAPAGTRYLYSLPSNTSGGVTAYFGSGDDTVTTSAFFLEVKAGARFTLLMPCSSTRTLKYLNGSGSGATHLAIRGFLLER